MAVHGKKRRRAAWSLLFVFLSLILLPAAVAAENEFVWAARFPSTELIKGVPPGWVMDRKAGTMNLALVQEGESVALHLTADRNSSFGIKREPSVDLRQYPFLNWLWKATRLPNGGDVRHAETDDQALQIYVAFPSTGFPAKLNTPVLGYIWDNEAPRGWTGRSNQVGGGKLRYVVVRNKADRLGEWRSEKRNLLEDFRGLFGDLKKVDPVTQGIELYTNAQHTKSRAEGWFGEIFFSQN